MLFAIAFPVVAFAAVAAWTRTASSPDFCSSCHSMEAATDSALQSLHSDLPCLACHGTTGAGGALAYLPGFMGEVGQVASGGRLAFGTLPTVPCANCHLQPVASAALLADGHPPGTSDCATCHGDVAHPGPTPVPVSSHPPRYDQVHGRDAETDPSTCVSCHEPEYCQACHVRVSVPHPPGWIAEHGAAQEELGAERCLTCHPPTFCKSCHGTEVPHRPTWLSEHYRALEETQPATCEACHAPSDCLTCHTQHQIHREQNLRG
jgi:hypothetical protein